MKKEFDLQTKNGTRKITLEIDEVYNVGYAGKDQEVVRKHVEELSEIGVAGPKSVPTIYPVSTNSLTTDTELEMIHDTTSGEIEYVFFISEGKQYFTVGSDHSDRDLEAYSVPMAKQICPNVVADTLWDYEEVKEHLDNIIMRSYATKDGVRSLYQEGTVGELLSPYEQLAIIEEHLGRKCKNVVIYSGTLPTKDGMVCGEKFEFEMVDEALGRKIEGEYHLKRLPLPRE